MLCLPVMRGRWEKSDLGKHEQNNIERAHKQCWEPFFPEGIRLFPGSARYLVCAVHLIPDPNAAGSTGDRNLQFHMWNRSRHHLPFRHSHLKNLGFQMVIRICKMVLTLNIRKQKLQKRSLPKNRTHQNTAEEKKAIIRIKKFM
ncbi:hypothetical protein ACH95_04660 [Bacillus glycinifermentans]|nr:hypothetical protein ACH95_04660 [Bacillus glycinifermentans]